MKKLCLIIGLLLISKNVFSYCDGCLNPYAGVEAQLRNFRTHQSLNGEYRKNAAQPHAIIGLNLLKGLAIEGGFAYTNSPQKGNNTYKIWDTHLGLVGYKELIPDLYLFLGAGTSKFKSMFSKYPADQKLRRMLFRGMAGVQRKVNETLSVRFSVIYQDTHKLKSDLLKTRNSVICSIGLIKQF